MSRTLFRNANIITTTGIHHGDVLTENGKIRNVCLDSGITDSSDRVFDLENRYLSPGFIDLHTHGAGGSDFMDGTAQAIYTACHTHMRHGTTSLLPTTVTGTRQSLFDFIDLFNSITLSGNGLPNILGLHLEGPYFSYAQRGAQDPKFLRNPDPDEYEAVFKRTNRIRRWSFAIELDGAQEFLSSLRSHGIISSLAHSDATCAQVMRAYENGLSALTHFYSGMSGVRRIDAYRVAGAIEAGYLLNDLYVEVIADGKHLPAELLQLIYQVKGADHICLVTDSMRAAGMGDGPSVLGGLAHGLDVIVEDGVAKLPDRSAFAGSVATMDRLVRTMKALTDAPLYEIVKMASITPARLVGIDNQKGSIAAGKDADLVVFDDDVRIHMVMVGGRIEYDIEHFLKQ